MLRHRQADAALPGEELHRLADREPRVPLAAPRPSTLRDCHETPCRYLVSKRPLLLLQRAGVRDQAHEDPGANRRPACPVRAAESRLDGLGTLPRLSEGRFLLLRASPVVVVGGKQDGRHQEVVLRAVKADLRVPHDRAGDRERVRLRRRQADPLDQVEVRECLQPRRRRYRLILVRDEVLPAGLAGCLAVHGHP